MAITASDREVRDPVQAKLEKQIRNKEKRANCCYKMKLKLQEFDYLVVSPLFIKDFEKEQ